ncbi:MAG TPA: substrate-binding domain-containing protein [Pseudonocardiaceae bacterium]
MAALDRDRAPVRFAVVTSVISGLSVTAITAWSRGGVALWLGSAGALVAVLALGFAWRRSRGGRQAFLMVSAFEGKYWVAELIQHLHRSLDRSGMDLVLKVPDRDYDASALAHHLRRVLARRHQYIGGIIVVTEVDRLRKDLVDFCARSSLPVVFADVEPFNEERDYPANSVFVGYRSGDLGELAGSWLVQHLIDTGQTRFRVLIIGGREHPWRQQRCAQVLRASNLDIAIATDDTCAFVRSRAEHSVRAHLRQLHQKNERLDAVFCTNDEMALGAVDALRSDPMATADTVVIGIDGTAEARALIDSGTSPFRATVVQDANRIAQSVVDMLEKLSTGQPVSKKTILTAEVYPAARSTVMS